MVEGFFSFQVYNVSGRILLSLSSGFWYPGMVSSGTSRSFSVRWFRPLRSGRDLNSDDDIDRQDFEDKITRSTCGTLLKMAGYISPQYDRPIVLKQPSI